MRDTELTGEATKIGRIAAIDVARGASLIGMVVYHLTWDLANFGFVPAGAPFSPEMRVFSHVVASAFLALVGVSLALAHPHGLRARAFARRFALVAGAALLVTLATTFSDPTEPIYFGILHCIAVASLVAAPFVGAPAWAALAAGVLALAAPLAIASVSFNAPALLWLGLGTALPLTLDWRPLLPWAGMVLVGLAVARGSLSRLARWPWTHWRPAAIPGRALGFAGRHSLAIYLVHQPILFALLLALANVSGVAERHERETYLAGCRPACVGAGGELAVCAKACACIADRAQTADVPLRAAFGQGGDGERQRLRSIVEACSAEAR
ncbi:MAG: heparan-alpha-glucosaminide N-acetyltransferase [Roseiarcus sp.]